MAKLNFTNEINGKDEETYIISENTSRQQMAKIMNRELKNVSALGLSWYENNTSTDEWAWVTKQENLDTLAEICEKYDWQITTTLEQPEITNSSDWRNAPATEKQIEYLHTLKVDLRPFSNLTKGLASDLITAAKDDQLGTVHGAFYMDGSN